MLLRRVLLQMGLQKLTMVVGGKVCYMMQIIFPPNEKKDVIVVLVTPLEKVQKSRERSLEIHVP